MAAFTVLAKRSLRLNLTQSFIYFNNIRHFKKILKRKPQLVLSETEAKKYGYESPFRSPHAIHNAQQEELKDEFDEAKTTCLASELRKEKFKSKYEDIPEYEKLTENDKEFTKMMSLIKSRTQREKKNKILLEGKRLIKEAIEAGIKLETIYFNKEDTISGLGLMNLTDLKLKQISYNHLKMWSELSTSPGIIGICSKPDTSKLKFTEEKIPVTLICDNIREPGNLGAILRCAAAAGCNKVLATTGCVDVWNSKVLRGAAGSHFHIPIINNIDWPSIRNYLPESFSIILAENKIFEDSLDTKTIRLPTHDYDNVEFTKDSHVALIVGGETEGVTSNAYELAINNKGFRINIPLANNIESLNAATACAVILFEINRQINN